MGSMPPSKSSRLVAAAFGPESGIRQGYVNQKQLFQDFCLKCSKEKLSFSWGCILELPADILLPEVESLPKNRAHPVEGTAERGGKAKS